MTALSLQQLSALSEAYSHVCAAASHLGHVDQQTTLDNLHKAIELIAQARSEEATAIRDRQSTEILDGLERLVDGRHCIEIDKAAGSEAVVVYLSNCSSTVAETNQPTVRDALANLLQAVQGP